jgi:aminoglycoside 6'-N-acetyltransferase I
MLGFVELSTRPYGEGCRTSRVAYLEGWFVVPEARRQGVGRALLEATEEWGRAQGCNELASDAHPDNDLSSAAHRSLGFADMGLVRCFRKEIG